MKVIYFCINFYTFRKVKGKRYLKRFLELFNSIDETTKTTEKVAALVEYFGSDENTIDKLWTVALFTHRRPPRTVSTTLLRAWSAEISGLPAWLFEETYHIVGDLAETIALVSPHNAGADTQALSFRINQIRQLKSMDESLKKQTIIQAWQEMDAESCFIFNKIITGGFRVGVSQKLIVKALSIHLKEEENRIAHRLMGNWHPDDTSWEELFLEDIHQADVSKPYPFYLAYSIEKELEEIGQSHEWSAEYKWDGIRGQLIKRKGQLFIWSRGEELVTEKYPEFDVLRNVWQDNFVIDGEILPYLDDKPLPFNDLQTRIGRKNLTSKILKEKPVILMAYDLLEYQGEDIRSLPYIQRRKYLHTLLLELNCDKILKLSMAYSYDNWQKYRDLHETASGLGAEGLMLKKNDSAYQIGRRKGDWWKWKIDPLTVDAVLIYAQRGHGRRATLYTDFTFAVWGEDGKLVPFAKAYSGLTDEEFKEISSFVKKNTLEKFGPVSAVKPELVFELAFEGIAKSPRHKSGIALRFPRMLRWRKDKSADQADHLASLLKLV